MFLVETSNSWRGKINNLGAVWTKKWIKEKKNRSNEASNEEAARLTVEAGEAPRAAQIFARTHSGS